MNELLQDMKSTEQQLSHNSLSHEMYMTVLNVNNLLNHSNNAGLSHHNWMADGGLAPVSSVVEKARRAVGYHELEHHDLSKAFADHMPEIAATHRPSQDGMTRSQASAENLSSHVRRIREMATGTGFGVQSGVPGGSPRSRSGTFASLGGSMRSRGDSLASSADSQANRGTMSLGEVQGMSRNQAEHIRQNQRQRNLILGMHATAQNDMNPPGVGGVGGGGGGRGRRGSLGRNLGDTEEVPLRDSRASRVLRRQNSAQTQSGRGSDGGSVSENDEVEV